MTTPIKIDPGPPPPDSIELPSEPGAVGHEADRVDAANLDPGIRGSWGVTNGSIGLESGDEGLIVVQEGSSDSLAAEANGRASSRLSGEVVEEMDTTSAQVVDNLSQELDNLATNFGQKGASKRPAPKDDGDHSSGTGPPQIPAILREWARERDLPNGLKHYQVEEETQKLSREIHLLCTVNDEEPYRFGRPLGISPSGRIGFFSVDGGILLLDNYYGTNRLYSTPTNVRVCGLVAKTDWTGVAAVDDASGHIAGTPGIYLCRFMLVDPEWSPDATSNAAAFRLCRCERLGDWTSVTAAFRQTGNVMAIVGDRLKVRLTLALFNIDTLEQRVPYEGMTAHQDMITTNWAGNFIYYSTDDGLNGTLCLDTEMSFEADLWSVDEYTVVRKPLDTSAVIRDHSNAHHCVRFDKPLRRYELIQLVGLEANNYSSVTTFEFETGAVVYTISQDQREMRIYFLDLLKTRVRPHSLETIAFLSAHAAGCDVTRTEWNGPLFCDPRRDARHFLNAEQFAFLLALKRQDPSEIDDLIEKAVQYAIREHGARPDQPKMSKRRRLT